MNVLNSSFGLTARPLATALRSSKFLYGLIICLLAAITPALPALATERDVPGTYATISAAISASSSGDVIKVTPNTYTNPGDYNLTLTADVTIESSSTTGAKVIINCGGNGEFLFISGAGASGSIIKGFTIENGSSNNSGAILIEDSSPTVENCTFIDNTALNFGGGISVLCDGTAINPIISDCQFFGNTVEGTTGEHPGFGGGVEWDQLDSPVACSLTVTDCIFSGNTAAYDGGAIDVSGNSSGDANPIVKIVNCSFNGNIAEGDAGTSGFPSPSTGIIPGGAIDTFAATVTLTNCILYGDTYGASTVSEISTLNPGVTATFSDVQGGASGTGNKNANPDYFATASRDLNLGIGSPCIGTGTSTGAPTTDYNGFPWGAAVSMGALSPIQVLVTAPSSATLGTAFSVGVSVKTYDHGTTITGYGGTLHFTSTDGAASLPIDSTLTNGTGTFSATLHTSGTKTITATDTVEPAYVGISNSITVAVSAPTANNQSDNVPFNTPTAVTLTGSDTNAGTLTYAKATSPAHGTLTGTAPNLTYTPTSGFNGTDSFTFTVTNTTTDLTSSPGTVTLTVAAGIPTATGQALSVPFNTPQAITLSGTDPDVPPLSLTFTRTTNPLHGTVTGTAPNLTYTPTSGYSGPDSFQFTAFNGAHTSPAGTVSLTVVAGTPTATGQTVAVPYETATPITLTGSDPDVPPLSLTYTETTQPTHGILTGSAPNVTYTPDAGFSGTDSFTFTVSNGTNTSSPATVTLNVAADVATHFAISTPSSATAGTAFNFTVTAKDASNITVPGYAGTVHFTSSDSGVGVVLPANSTLVNGTGTFSATLETPGSQTITATDIATSSITGTSGSIVVSSVVGTPTANGQTVSVPFETTTPITLTGSDPDDPPLSLTYAEATQPTHGTLSGSAPNVTYTPDAGFSGTDSFTFTVSNGTNTSSPATVTLNVAADVATHFAVSAPSSATAGTAFDVTVTAEDASNNTVPGYAGTVHFTTSDPGAGVVLPANSTLVNGTGTFSATLVTPGSQTITATDTATSSITGTSNAINVAGVTDVSGQVTVAHGGFRLKPGTTIIGQILTLTNNGAAITGPISLVLTGLSSNATLSGATGSTSVVAPAGRPYINVAGLAAGASETVPLQFNDPTETGITYTTQVLAGPGPR